MNGHVASAIQRFAMGQMSAEAALTEAAQTIQAEVR
jgi:maltose-binding protein MalE